MPAEQLMWARNTLTQRVIGPKSIATVELYVGGMKEGDVAGLGNINVPCSWIGVEQGHYGLLLRCFEQAYQRHRHSGHRLLRRTVAEGMAPYGRRLRQRPGPL